MTLDITSLLRPDSYDHPVTSVELIETHISWVLLTGDYAYKIKKPVNFGFLDFSTLEKRRFYCQEELRLNRRLAPELYLDVVNICSTNEHLQLNGSGPVIEYAVKMQQFPQSAQLDNILSKQGLDKKLIDKLAKKVAAFHLSIASVDQDSHYGDLEHIQQPMLENFRHIRENISDQSVDALLDQLEQWTHQHLSEFAAIIQQRKQTGAVRECHGDMHLRNIAYWRDEIVIFDCIEFNPNFYWIDVISEIAFLIMDLEDRQQEALARRFLNSYIEITGDYEGLRLLRLYKVYRAMVRAKVDALRTVQEQPGTKEFDLTYADFKQYLKLAESYTYRSSPTLMITHGLSGSGKTYTTRLILELYPAIHLRSDVERKRIYNQQISDHGQSEIEGGIYTKEATIKTYQRLADLAGLLVRSGFSVVVDAANLKSTQRQQFHDLAKELDVPFVMLDYSAPPKVLESRIQQRMRRDQDASDATLEVLAYQQKNHEPLTDQEKAFTVTIDTEKRIDIDHLVDRIISLAFSDG